MSPVNGPAWIKRLMQYQSDEKHNPQPFVKEVQIAMRILQKSQEEPSLDKIAEIIKIDVRGKNKETLHFFLQQKFKAPKNAQKMQKDLVEFFEKDRLNEI
jgi:hypothetical protein